MKLKGENNQFLDDREELLDKKDETAKELKKSLSANEAEMDFNFIINNKKYRVRKDIFFVLFRRAKAKAF